MTHSIKKKLAFSKRNIREILREPLSYIFCLAFPLVMLLVMTLVNSSIPVEANMTVFRIQNLAPGIAVFGQTFVMLFTALMVSKDRAGSFLVRLYATPMKPADFIVGYALPALLISVMQTLIVYAVALPVSWVTGPRLNPLGLLLSLLTLIPSAVMFIGFGMLFGTLLSDKSAPGLCSIVISLGSFLGCIWFDADATGGVMLNICRALPFYYCTRSARAAAQLNFDMDRFGMPLLIVCACAAVLIAIAAAAFRAKMKADLA